MDIISFVNQSAFYFGAVFVAFSCLTYTHIHKNMEKPQTLVFNVSLWIIIVTSLFDMIAIFVEPLCKDSVVAQYTLYVSHYLYFVLHNMMAMLLCYYAFFATQTFIRMTHRYKLIYMIPFMISELFVLTNPWNHFTWYYDENFHFHRNWAEASIYISGIIYYAIAIYYLVFRWYAATRKRKLMITISFFMTVIGITIQFFVPAWEVELFFDAITFLGIMLSVEYDDDRVDTVTKMYNRDAFVQDVSYYLDTKTSFHAVILKLTNMEAYQMMPEAYDLHEVISSAAEGIRKLFIYPTCYRVTPVSIVMLILNKDDAYMEELSGKVLALLNEGLALPKRDERITGVVMQAQIPDEVSSIQDIMLMIEMDYKEIPYNKIAKGETLHEFYDRASVERAMREGFDNDGYEVLYQPVFSVKEKKIQSLEALIRLNDSKLGQLLSEYFIPEAERNGMIDIISDFVLRDACSLIKSGIPDKLGIKYINVNLSVLQCIQSHFIERVTAIVEDEEVSPSRIIFGVFESVTLDDFGNLAEVIKECRKIGFRFSMEGYGTGYANIYSVFSMHFNEIKIDKTMIWEAVRSERGRIILENSVKMIHEMGLTVVAVGVETAEQIDLVEKLDVELVQGFYCSEPVRKEELLDVD